MPLKAFVLAQIQGDDLPCRIINKAVEGTLFPAAEPVKTRCIGLQEFSDAATSFPPGKSFSTIPVFSFRCYAGGFEHTAECGI
jgi:hypothetical protein